MTIAAPVPEGPPGSGLFELASFNVSPSEGFVEWLEAEDASLAVTMGNQLALIGRDREGRLRVQSRLSPGAAGLGVAGSQSLYLTSGWQLTRFENALDEGELDSAGHDRLFLPQTAATIGAVGSYDIAVPETGPPLFSVALCNCVATVSRRLNFTAVWKPPFISELVGEDRCHLTGLALDGDELAYVTCTAESDVEGEWRNLLNSGGVVVDVQTDHVLTTGISLPHSPRLHEGALYVAGSGDGVLLRIDTATGDAEVVASLPGLVRGLDFSGGFAVVGCSKVLEDGPYAGIPVAGMPASAQRHGVMVVDLATGERVHDLIFEAASGEVVSVALIRGSRHAAVAEGVGRGWEQLPVGHVERPSKANTHVRKGEG